MPINWSRSKETLPIGAWTLPYRSLRYSIRPALNSSTALPTSTVTVPAFGFGINPRGPEDTAQLPHLGHQVGRRHGDVEVERLLAFLNTRHQLGTADDVGTGGLGLARLVGLGEHGHPDCLPGAVGEAHRAPDHLVGARVDPELERNLDRLVKARRGEHLDQVDSLTCAAAL